MLTAERLREVMNYDPLTGQFSWRVRLSNRAPAGSLCTNKDRHGYIRVRIDGQLYWAARLAWFYVHGRWPPNDIDHIDGTRDNNAITNLREATRSQNLSNRKPGRAFKGAYYNRRQNRWHSAICVNRVSHYLGMFKTEREAHQAYAAASAEHHGQFARVK